MSEAAEARLEASAAPAIAWARAEEEVLQELERLQMEQRRWLCDLTTFWEKFQRSGHFHAKVSCILESIEKGLALVFLQKPSEVRHKGIKSFHSRKGIPTETYQHHITMKRQVFFQTFRREEGVADRVREQADELQMEESLAVQKQEEAAHAREEAKKDGQKLKVCRPFCRCSKRIWG